MSEFEPVMPRDPFTPDETERIVADQEARIELGDTAELNKAVAQLARDYLARKDGTRDE